MARIVPILAAALLIAAPLLAQAQSFRCTDADGRKHYGSTIPPECLGQPIEQLNRQGMVIKRIDPEGGEKERLAKEAAAAKKREEEAAAKEEARRNRALLATYMSERDIEDARKRALAENAKARKDIESRMAAIRKRQSGHEKELELYKGQSKPPGKLADEIKSAERELKLQEEMREANKRNADGINAKYDEEKKRFLELTRRR
jgi:hypothetical protein